jgi:hypothetical protein
MKEIEKTLSRKATCSKGNWKIVWAYNKETVSWTFWKNALNKKW